MLLMPLLGGRWNFLSVPAPIRLIEKREMLVALYDHILLSSEKLLLGIRKMLTTDVKGDC